MARGLRTGWGMNTNPMISAAPFLSNSRIPLPALGEMDEGLLVQRWLRGDARALAALADRHTEALREHLVLRFGREIADEAVSDTLLKLARGARYTHQGSFRAWFFTVGRRCALDLCRSHKRSYRLADAVERDTTRRHDSAIAPKLLVRSDQRAALEKEIDALPTLHRKAISMRYFGDLSTTEIGRRLDLTPSKVRDRIAYALRALRERMAGKKDL